MTMTPEEIHRLWRGDVIRYSHNPDPKLRNSGDTNHLHSYRMALLGMTIFGPDVWTRRDFEQAIAHDIGESWYGDPSHEAKRDPAIKAAHDAAERRVLIQHNLPTGCSERVALMDRLDACLWCREHSPDTYAAQEWRDARHSVILEARRLGVGEIVEGMV